MWQPVPVQITRQKHPELFKCPLRQFELLFLKAHLHPYNRCHKRCVEIGLTNSPNNRRQLPGTQDAKNSTIAHDRES